MIESDWEEYYRNVNVLNIPNADAKRVEIWDKAFLSTKTVRETIWEIYSKGFMDGVNDQAKRYKDSAFRQKHDSELLDKVAERIHQKMCSENCGERQCVDSMDRCVWYWYINEAIEEMKAEVEE